MKHKLGTFGYISTWIGTKEEDKLYYKNLDLLTHNLVPTVSVDWMHAQLYTNTVQAYATIGCNYLAVSETAIAPDETWTETLFRTSYGEITTGLLARKQASPAPSHIAGTNVSLIEATWTPNASFPNVQVLALITAGPTGGILGHVGRFDTIAAVTSGQAFRALATINHGA